MTEKRSLNQEEKTPLRKIGILGGDVRQLVTAQGLLPDYECAVWGFDSVYGTPDDGYLTETVRCADWESAVRCSDAVILPLPCTRDGTTLSTPLNRESRQIGLLEIVDRMDCGALLTGGLLPPIVRRYAAEHGIRTADYYDSEELQILNAVPTAEGAVAACISTLPITVAGMKAVVFGYGRVGRTLAQRLLALGAEVYAAARSVKDRAWAQCDGCVPVPLEEYCRQPVKADVIFNTVPHRILDETVLAKIPTGSVLFELAQGCCDAAEAERYGIRVIPLPSVPGKTSPVTSGQIICRAVKEILKTDR